MSDLTWQDPPPSRGSRPGLYGKWEQIVDSLNSRPGQWALIASTEDHGYGYYQSKRLGLERAARKNPDGTWDIYMRAPEATP